MYNCGTMSPDKKVHFWKIFNLILFSTAMGLLEAVVVVYLRRIYYVDGFTFPLKMMDTAFYRTEVLREIATILMLVGVCAAAGQRFYERFAYFLMTFAIWDIFYYVFLKVFLNWPLTLLDWDILFLIPITWVGPVLSPVLCSLVMLLMTALILRDLYNEHFLPFNWYEWTCILGGAFIIFLTYVRDYTGLLLSSGMLTQGGQTALVAFQNVIQTYIPQTYAWGWFALGMGVILAGVFSWQRRIRL
jgi:hypothetical protein